MRRRDRLPARDLATEIAEAEAMLARIEAEIAAQPKRRRYRAWVYNELVLVDPPPTITTLRLEERRRVMLEVLDDLRSRPGVRSNASGPLHGGETRAC